MSLKDRLSRPGFVVSALVHAGALAALLVTFSSAEKFDDPQETVPVEVITDSDFNQIMKGDHAAKEVHPDATAEPETLASAEATPPTPEPVHPPPPPPPPPPPSPPSPPPQATEEPPPTPPERPAPAPAPEQEATPPVPTPPVREVEAEPDLPKPVPKPVVKPTPPVPVPPVVPHPIVKAHLPPPPKPRPVEKPKPDLIAKLMETQPTAEVTPPTPKPSIRRPKPAPQTSPDSTFDPTDISKLLSHDTPSAKPAASHEMSHLASLGAPTASAPKMSPSFWAGLDGLLEDQYRSCWSYLGLAAGSKYIPQVRVVYGADGTLEGQPVLINPPADPAMRSLADSALRAVRRCNPLKIPEQYAPYYEEWKGRVLRFDPEEMAG